ncbi:uncharacterized protein LOC141620054 [Silene latifolia]|uniref:uncharacterized protein LOC141620054 n=1 Tax=Silene latifolia TaxID=37657 RepID=UPI003D777C23
MECQKLVLQQGFSIFDNKPLLIKPWTAESSLTKERGDYVLVWVRLCGLGLKFWGKTCLEKIAGLVGKFIKVDGATGEKTRLGYARIMLELEVGQELPDLLLIKDEKGSEISILVEYKWKPVICTLCKGIGHGKDVCRKKQIPAPVVKANTWVWRPVAKGPVQKPYGTVVRTPGAGANPLPTQHVIITPYGGLAYHNSSLITPTTVLTQVTRQEFQTGQGVVSPSRTCIDAVRNRSPTKNGIKEQEEPPGNDDLDYLVTSILQSSAQLITAQVGEINSGESFLFSVVYGYNDDSDRMDLWDQLKDIQDNHDGPWGICGDFNNVLNFNERIGRDV